MMELFNLTRMRTVSILKNTCRKKRSITTAEEHKPVHCFWLHGGLSPLPFEEIKYNTQETLECFRGLPYCLEF